MATKKQEESIIYALNVRTLSTSVNKSGVLLSIVRKKYLRNFTHYYKLHLRENSTGPQC